MADKKDPKKKTEKKAAPAKARASAPAPAKAAVRRSKASRPKSQAAAAATPVRERARVETPDRPRPTGVQDLRPAVGATRGRKRVGRGPGSGHGKTAGRGNKGQKSRSGYRHQRGFEGGQMPLHRRIPKRGFTNIFRVEYDVVNLRDLDRFDSGDTVNPEKLAEQRLAHGRRPVKILGDGEIKKPLTVSAHKFSASARSRIEAAGGRCDVIGPAPSRTEGGPAS